MRKKLFTSALNGNARYVVPALVLLAIPCHAQRSTQSEAACFALGSQADARYCLDARAKQSDADLKNAEAKFALAIEKWDQESAYKIATKRLNATARAAYKKYRQEQCDLYVSMAGGGNGAGDRKLLCYIELNRRRIADLNGQLADIASTSANANQHQTGSAN